MKEFLSGLKFTWKYCKSKKWRLLLFFLSNMGALVVGILLPLYYSKVVVEITNNDFYRIFLMCLILLFLELFRVGFRYLISYFSQKIYKTSVINIQTDLGNEVLKLENKTMEENGSGVFIQRLTGDATTLADIFNEIVMQFSDIMSYIGRFIAIYIVSKPIFYFLVLGALLLGIVEKIRANNVTKQDKIYREKREKASGFIGELVRGNKDIKMLNAEKSFMKEFNNIIIDSNEALYKRQGISRNFWLFSGSGYAFLDFIMMMILLFLLIKESIDITDAMIIWNYSGGLLYCVSNFGNILDRVKNFNLSVSRVREIIDSKKFKKENFGTKHLDHINGDFEFKNVSFAYGKEKVLEDISFKINANETVAFVGKSGSGKSTIFSLLCKLYEVDKGIIKIDGVNIKKLDRETIRGNITIISQDPYIFNMSIRDNLKLVKENLTEEEMIEACKLACLDDYIESLPEKYDTMIGEGGINLSGGQKQRLAIARALVQKTEIILFDEATSALDNETQSKIQKAIENMKNEYTILIIAHRLSTIINADRILFINDGKVEMEGTHKSLLKRNKNYKNLYEAELMNRE